MSAIAIKIDDLSKKYILTHQKVGRYTALRDVMVDKAKNLARRARHPFSAGDDGPTREEFWALKDVSCEIRHGDRAGIIGRNGAGKSTLLKIISRITEPTSGKVSIKGRVASLLEVGTGFHPELSGRENIFLNGAILGMRKAEIKRKFDEIVDFAEVEKFLDTPVKRYSSGMYVRLAFAVAAHLEPEILVVDEVLAVGDAGFQKKCMAKMEKVSSEGRTILFVSHNMAAITSLTNTCIELTKGVVTKYGLSADVVEHYLQNCALQSNNNGEFDLTNAERPPQKIRIEDSRAHFVRARCVGDNGTVKASFQERESIAVEVYLKVKSTVELLELHLSVVNMSEVRVFSALSDVMAVNLEPGVYKSVLNIDPNYLRPGDYVAALNLYAPALQDGIKNAVNFRIEPSSEGDSNVNWSYHNLGVVRFPYEWTKPESVSSKGAHSLT